MSKKRARPTDTISFRADSLLVKAIKDAAKKENTSVGEYILSQVEPDSELGRIISTTTTDALLNHDNLRHKAVQSALSEILASQPTIRTAFVDFITGLTELKQQSDKEGHDFKEVLNQTITTTAKER